MPRHESWRRSHLSWAAVNSQPTLCAAQLLESTLSSQPGSRVNLDRTAGPEPDDNSARTPLGMARLAGDELAPAFPIHQLRRTARWQKPNGSHQLRGG
jgi:hypothetical protein